MTLPEIQLKTNTAVICDYCEEGHLVEESYSQVVRFGRASLTVAGLSRSRCDACDTVVTTGRQYESNADLVRAAEKRTPGYLSPAMLREFREKNGLSQRVAGKLIGVGAGAFGKYETGSKLSAPTAKLIRAALAFPEVARMLAEEEGIEIATSAFEEEWKQGKFIYRPSLTKAAAASQNDDAFSQASDFTNLLVWQKTNQWTLAA